MYDFKYGLRSKLAENSNPLSAVKFKDNENTVDDSYLTFSMKRYIRSGIKQIFNLSYSEYIELPMDYIEAMDTIAVEELEKKNDAMSDLQSELED